MSAVLPPHFGQRLRWARRAAGLSQEELGEALGLSDRTVRNWESGGKAPRMQRLEQLARVLDQPVAWFFAPQAAHEGRTAEGVEPLLGEHAEPPSPEPGLRRAAGRPSQRVERKPIAPVSRAAGRVEALPASATWEDVLAVLGIPRIAVYDQVPAGSPRVPAPEVLEEVEVPARWAGSGGVVFGLRVRGDSMEPLLRAGDLLVVRAQPDAEHGQVVVVTLASGEFVVKRLRRLPGAGAALHSDNPAYPPILLSGGDAINGRVVGVLRDL